jgi:hypothetical protein
MKVNNSKTRATRDAIIPIKDQFLLRCDVLFWSHEDTVMVLL